MSSPSWLVECVTVVPDFPKPGIQFMDLSPLWASPAAVSRCAVALAADSGAVDVVVGVEARGFLAGLVTAQRLGVGFVAARKPGKLPGPLLSVSYELEYGSDTLELQAGAIDAGANVLVVDDVIATGGTVAAVCSLIANSDATVSGIRAVLEFDDLGGRDRLRQAGVDPSLVRSLWSLSSEP